MIDDSKSFTINGKTIILVNVALQVFLDRLISDRSRTEGCIANPPEVSAPKLYSQFRKFELLSKVVFELKSSGNPDFRNHFDSIRELYTFNHLCQVIKAP